MLRHCLFIKGSSKCVSLSRLKRTRLLMTDFEFCIYHGMSLRVFSMCILCVCLCVRSVRCSCLHASERSQRLAAESQGLRRQEIKHEMKTSSSLNILPSHFPISPLPLADLEARRVERDMESEFGSGGLGVAGVGEKRWEFNQVIKCSGFK